MSKIETFQIYVRTTSNEPIEAGRVFYVFGERIEIGTSPQRRSPIPFTADSQKPLSARDIEAQPLIPQPAKAVMETIELDDSDPRLGGKKFASITWSEEKKRVLFQAFAQKPTDFLVYMSRHEAMKYIDANNVFVQKGQDTFHVGTPLFRILATEIDLSGKAAYQITKIDKAYFRGESGAIDAGLGEVAISDQTNTDANDFIFTADRIQDTIIPAIPVTVTQDTKINTALMIFTFLFQVIQWALTRYLPTPETQS